LRQGTAPENLQGFPGPHFGRGIRKRTFGSRPGLAVTCLSVLGGPSRKADIRAAKRFGSYRPISVVRRSPPECQFLTKPAIISSRSGPPVSRKLQKLSASRFWRCRPCRASLTVMVEIVVGTEPAVHMGMKSVTGGVFRRLSTEACWTAGTRSAHSWSVGSEELGCLDGRAQGDTGCNTTTLIFSGIRPLPEAGLPRCPVPRRNGRRQAHC
jgi:hypothetical protein